MTPHGVNLLEARQLSPGEAQSRWRKTIEALNALPMPSSPGRKSAATHDDAVEFHRALKNHPLAKTMWRYAQNEQGEYVGGCFATKFLGHLMALSHFRYHKDSIATGVTIFDDKANNSHHVWLALRATDGGWWRIDPESRPDGPEKIETSLASTFIAQANRWGPGDLRPIDSEMHFLAQRYSPEHLFKYRYPGTSSLEVDRNAPLMNGFMADVQTWFRENRHLRRVPNPTESTFEHPAARIPVATAPEQGVATTFDRPRLVVAHGVNERNPTASAAMNVAESFARNAPSAVANRVIPSLINLAKAFSGHTATPSSAINEVLTCLHSLDTPPQMSPQIDALRAMMMGYFDRVEAERRQRW